MNTSRGPVIDEAALAEALRDGVIFAAGLDVFEIEPLPADDELTRLPNVVLTGHVASFSVGGMASVMDSTVNGLIDIVEGRIPPGCVNPIVLRSSAPNSQPASQ